MPKFDKKRTQLHPKSGWICPKCQTRHDFPHWKDHHQINKVEDKEFCEDGCKESDEFDEFEEDCYTPKPLFCPCCGYEEERLQLIKLKRGEVVEIA